LQYGSGRTVVWQRFSGGECRGTVKRPRYWPATSTAPHKRLNVGPIPQYNHWLCNIVLNAKERAMARVCQITGKAPMVGNNVSHANNKTKRRFLPNLQRRKFWVESENRWISLRLTNAALRTIDKKGIDLILTELRARGEKV